MARAGTRSWGHTVGWAAGYAAAATVGLLTVPEGGTLALFWPAAGVGVLWLLTAGSVGQALLDLVLMYAAIVTLALLLSPLPVAATVLLSLGHPLLSLAFRRLYQHLRGLPWAAAVPLHLDSARELLRLLAVAAAAAALTAPVPLLSTRLAAGVWLWQPAAAWTVRNTVGAVVVAAVALLVWQAVVRRTDPRGPALEPRPHAVAELIAVCVAGGVLALYVFGPLWTGLPISFVFIAALAWVGSRFTPVVVAVFGAVFGLVAIVGTLAGEGVLGDIADPLSQAVVVQLFIGLGVMVGLLLALTSWERLRVSERLAESERGAREQASLLESVTESMSDGLVVIDEQGQVLLRNPAAVALYGGGGRPTDRAGAPDAYGFFELDGSRIRPEQQPHARALAGEAVSRTLLHVHPESGRRTVVSVSAAPLAGVAAGRTVAVLLRDVTEDRERLAELQAFAGVVAHDLKNPLAGAIGWARLLRQQLAGLGPGPDRANAEASLGRVEGSFARMDRLIDDLLAYSMAGSQPLRPEPVDLDALVDRVAQAVTAAADGRPMQVSAASLGRVHGDPVLIEQVITNLLGNAVKYVAAGDPAAVEVAARPIGDQVEIRVTDNGIGISPADRERVFESFFRAHHDYPGTGLGLAICQRAVERHGGSIAVGPGPGGRGTTVCFTLPAPPRALPPDSRAA